MHISSHPIVLLLAVRSLATREFPNTRPRILSYDTIAVIVAENKTVRRPEDESGDRRQETGDRRRYAVTLFIKYRERGGGGRKRRTRFSLFLISRRDNSRYSVVHY